MKIQSPSRYKFTNQDNCYNIAGTGSLDLDNDGYLCKWQEEEAVCLAHGKKDGCSANC